MAAFGAHNGDVYLWNFEDPTRDQKIEGTGCGHSSITDMKFHPDNPSHIYTTSVDGRFCLQDLEGKLSQVYLDTLDYRYWWCTVNISREHNAIFVGDNTGNAVILNSDGQPVCKYRRLHKGKIKHAEFCPARSWMLLTASVDYTVKLWDIRMLHSETGNVTTKPKPIAGMVHEGVVTSAYFDPIYGSRILTTAHNSELRVYDPHHWTEPSIIVKHPHRNFQHMTDIRATWHPFYENLCVVGRYPAWDDSIQRRCVDLIDLESGQRVGCHYSPQLTGIIQVNKFNRFGDSLASGMGYTCLIWRAPDEKSIKRAREEAKSMLSARSGEQGVTQPRKRKREGSGKEKKAKIAK